ncbi:MAG: glutamine-hydrolyzing carbamoyl-phosphate synthase small subunit [Proteobacteria bacterium]|nr:carbamoyl-phosphate synthase small subunit [Pseudomonadota bacterium]NOG59806.1 glutamine-hydrolyzing carbamoyl-phosphate synthase small subunit [Pseudomonadota bacterium]
MSGNALLALEDGSLFYGTSIGIDGEAIGEVVFNTAITGYQEIITDPSYYKQIVTLTHPHIGNVGTNPEDEESDNVFISGLVIRDLPLVISSWRATENLSDYLNRHNIVAIAGIDTRQLTRHLRKNGAMKACVVAGANIDADKAIETAKSFAGLVGMDLAKEVSTKDSYYWNETTWDLEQGVKAVTGKKDFRVIAYDFGVKRNILRLLVDQGCEVKVVPAQTSANEVLAEKPDGVFLSNGPGDPEPCDYAITAIKEIIETGLPVFGICLGLQLLSLALGAKTVKMKFGHHGANHPVQALDGGQVLITSQNHGFAVDEESLPDCLTATHRSLFDGSLQGVHHKERPVFGFQGHPEASPGPHDIQSLFIHFSELMKAHKS